MARCPLVGQTTWYRTKMIQFTFAARNSHFPVRSTRNVTVCTESLGELERERQSAGKLLHFFLCQLTSFFLRLGYSRQHQILEHLDIG